MARAFREAEAGRSLSLRSALSTGLISEQSGLDRETLSPKTNIVKIYLAVYSPVAGCVSSATASKLYQEKCCRGLLKLPLLGAKDGVCYWLNRIRQRVVGGLRKFDREAQEERRRG